MSDDPLALVPELELGSKESRLAIQNLWPLYLHDISAYDGRLPNAAGVIGESESPDRWGDPGEAWWSRPDCLFPYLVRVGPHAAGFCLVAGGPYAEQLGVEFTVQEFFIAKPFRGSAVASQAALLSIGRHRGRWEVVTYPNAFGPIAFWQKILPRAAKGPIQQDERDHLFGRKVVFQFEN